jgi:peroxiredoxin
MYNAFAKLSHLSEMKTGWHFQFGGRNLLASLLTRRFVLVVAGVVWVALVGSGCVASSAQVRLLDLTGQPVEPLQESHAKAVVFLFIRTDCPISNRYAPEVRRLYEKFAASGVTFWLVYPDPDESVEMIRQHISEHEYRLGVLRDPQHALVKLTGVRVTPEAAVFAAGRIVYRGRIDNRYVAFGKARPAPTAHDLEAILEALVQGKMVTPETTTAIGCFIPEL